MYTKKPHIFLIVMLVALSAFLLSWQGCTKKTQDTQSEITVNDLAEVITAYVAEESSDNDGLFIIMDDTTGENVELVLDKVHKKMLHKTGENKYFACADFTTEDGVVYDLDFIVEGPDKGNLAVSEVMIHKVGGKERYSWREDDGIWIKEEV